LKALIVRQSSIGDVVHTLPALAALAGAGWEVDWLVEPGAVELLSGQPLVANLVRVPRARLANLPASLRAARGLRQRSYDVVLDFQGLWKSAGWARLARSRRVVGFGRAWRREPSSALLIKEPLVLSDDVVHVIDKNLALLRGLSIEAVGQRSFPLPPSDERAERIAPLVGELGLGPFVILNPGGGWASKLWPAERFGALARALKPRGLASLVTWGPGEEALARRVVDSSNGAARLCFPTSLLDLAEVSRYAAVFVAADTGPLQLACAVGVPVVALFGPTDPKRNGPFCAADIVVRRTPLCAPCHRRRCAIHDGVMEAIQPEEVAAAVERRRGAPAPRARRARGDG